MYVFSIIKHNEISSIILTGKIKLTNNNNNNKINVSKTLTSENFGNLKTLTSESVGNLKTLTSESFGNLKNQINKHIDNPSISYFYTPKNKIHPSMKLLSLYSSDLNSNNIDFVSWNSEEVGFSKITSCYVFPKEIEKFNSSRISIIAHSSNIGLDIRWGLRKDELLSFYVFKNPKKIRLYTLAAIIWPPAYNYSNEIAQIIEQHYHITKNNDFFVPKQRLSRFVKNIYKGDMRCDKSQLPSKCRHMYPYRPNMKYLQFLVEEPDLDKMRVSQTAVKIKELIRGGYQRKIPNYVHDIIFHISDNVEHAKSMDKFVTLELK